MLKTFSVIWKFSKKRHGALSKALIFSFLRSVFAICQMIAIIEALHVLIDGKEVKTAVIHIALLTLICIAGNFITSYFEQSNTLKTGFFMTADQRVSVANRLKQLPLGFFNDTSCGRVTATLTTTLTGVESAAAMVMTGIISGLFHCITFLVFMLFYEYRIGIVTGVGMMAYLLIVNHQMRLSEKNAPKLQKAQTRLAEAALNFIQGIKVTKAFSFKNGDLQLKEAINESCKENISLTRVSMPSQGAAGLCIAAFESVILLMSFVFYTVTEDLSLAKALLLLIFSFMAYASLNQAGSMLSMIGLLDVGLKEVESIEENEPLPVSKPTEKMESNKIRLEDVCFSYGQREVLRHVSTEIEEQSFTAIIGPSGSGKTTLCQLIPRFRDVTSGSIKIGNVDVKNVEYKDLMAKISMVFQNVYLFEDTVFNNIRFGRPDATEEEVVEAAKKASCHSFILSMENGYQTVLEEGGAGLSGGEKQRISIARAILKDAPIVILDEATSALDAENEDEILSAIGELTKNKTVIMIAHRLKTVEHADHIIALKDGEIVEEGTHQQLQHAGLLYEAFLKSRAEAGNWKIERTHQASE